MSRRGLPAYAAWLFADKTLELREYLDDAEESRKNDHDG
jgi:hypothetical protein